LSSPALETAHVALAHSQQFANDPSFYYYALEVRSRLEFEQGNTIGAEETIEEIEASGMNYCPEFPARLGFTKAKLNLRRGKREEAESELRKIARTCHEESNLYHAVKAENELVRLIIA
jgi:ATP/maltotriose-dependent transcriptional regulator MalT